MFLNAPRKRNNYQRGEITTILTLVGMGVMLLGAMVGSWAIKTNQRQTLQPKAFGYLSGSPTLGAFTPADNTVLVSGNACYTDYLASGNETVSVWLTGNDVTTSTKDDHHDTYNGTNGFELTCAHAQNAMSLAFHVTMKPAWKAEGCKATNIEVHVQSDRRGRSDFSLPLNSPCPSPTPTVTPTITPTPSQSAGTPACSTFNGSQASCAAPSCQWYSACSKCSNTGDRLYNVCGGGTYNCSQHDNNHDACTTTGYTKGCVWYSTCNKCAPSAANIECNAPPNTYTVSGTVNVTHNNLPYSIVTILVRNQSNAVVDRIEKAPISSGSVHSYNYTSSALAAGSYTINAEVQQTTGITLATSPSRSFTLPPNADVNFDLSLAIAPTATLTQECQQLFNILTASMGKRLGETGYNAVADLNTDNIVNADDLAIFSTNSQNRIWCGARLTPIISSTPAGCLAYTTEASCPASQCSWFGYGCNKCDSKTKSYYQACSGGTYNCSLHDGDIAACTASGSSKGCAWYPVCDKCAPRNEDNICQGGFSTISGTVTVPLPSVWNKHTVTLQRLGTLTYQRVELPASGGAYSFSDLHQGSYYYLRASSVHNTFGSLFTAAVQVVQAPNSSTDFTINKPTVVAPDNGTGIRGTVHVIAHGVPHDTSMTLFFFKNPSRTLVNSVHANLISGNPTAGEDTTWSYTNENGIENGQYYSVYPTVVNSSHYLIGGAPEVYVTAPAQADFTVDLDRDVAHQQFAAFQQGGADLNCDFVSNSLDMSMAIGEFGKKKMTCEGEVLLTHETIAEIAAAMRVTSQ